MELDIHKDGISISGLSLRYLWKTKELFTTSFLLIPSLIAWCRCLEYGQLMVQGIGEVFSDGIDPSAQAGTREKVGKKLFNNAHKGFTVEIFWALHNCW